MLRMVRSKTQVARSHLCDRSVGFSCEETVLGASVVDSCILESMTKVDCCYTLLHFHMF